MKFIALLLTICISFNVSASTIKELDLLVDNYQYDLSVEWDQNDKKFYEEKTNHFFSELSVLMASKKITSEDLVAFVEKKISNKAELEAMKLKLTLLGQVKTPEQLSRVLQEHTKSFYFKGASWNGQAVASVVVGALVLGLIGYVIWHAANYECVEWEQKWVCHSYDRNDYGGYTYTETICGYEDVCTRQEKK